MNERLASTLALCRRDEMVTLPSGLRVVVRPMPGYSSVHCVYATRFGSVDTRFRLGEEELSLPAGVAHFLEHKMFEDEDGDAFAKFAKTGASANAFTSFDRTCYLFTATEQVEESLDILLGMVARPYFTEQTIAKEQGIIGQEIKMYDDNPDWRLLTGLCSCLYHEHPIRCDIAGTVESIAQITPQMLYDCCSAFYAPSNMVLAAAGNITMETLLAACRRAGLDAPRTAPVVQRLWNEEPLTVAKQELTIKMAVSKPCIGIGFKEVPLEEDDPFNEVLYSILSDCIVGGMSPLYRRLYDAGLINPGFDGELLKVPGCSAFIFTGESDQPLQVRDELLREIRRIRAEGVDQELFTLCKHQKHGELIQLMDNVEDSAGQIAELAMSKYTFADQIEQLARMSKADADEAMQRLFSEERMATMLILPDGTAPEEPDEEEEEDAAE